MADDKDNAIVVSQDVQLGSIQTADPAQFFERAKTVADALVKLVNDKKLYSIISGRKYLQVAGWAYAGAMMGVMAREVSAVERENGDVEATVELIRASDGAVIGRGSAIVGMDEVDNKGKLTWGSRPRYARRSMAITRAEGKAFRLAFPWLVALAGYEATPAEEMDGLNIVEGQVAEPTGKKTEPIEPKPTRPYEADFLRERIHLRIVEHAVCNASKEQIGLVASMIEYPFIVVKDAKTKENMRHTVVKYLLGQPSLRDAKGEEIMVLMDWLKPVKDTGGAYAPDRLAEQECEKVWTAANLEAGQLKLPEEK
jgi:hypothetical protein